MKPKIHFSAPVPAGDLTKAVQPARLQHLGSNYYLQTKKGLQFLSPHSLQMMPVNILVWSRSHCSQEHRGQLSLGAAYILCQCAKHKGLMQKRPSITIEVQFRVIYTHTHIHCSGKTSCRFCYYNIICRYRTALPCYLSHLGLLQFSGSINLI